MTKPFSNPQPHDFPGLLSNIRAVEAEEALMLEGPTTVADICAAIESLGPLGIFDVLRLLKSVEFGCDGDSSIAIQKALEDLTDDARTLYPEDFNGG